MEQSSDLVPKPRAGKDKGGAALKRKRSSATGEDVVKKSGSLYMADVIREGKKKMQDGKTKNGITVCILGGSGRGKSTILRKIFLDDIYKDKEFINIVFTESGTSDAFDKLDKSVTVDSMGIDTDAIHFMYKMNQEYDKKYNFVVLIDDCVHIRYMKMVERMFLTMRNSNITSVVSTQHAKLLPPSIRNSIYFAICTGFNAEDGSEVCVRTWLSGYLPGNNIHEKLYHYQEWAQEGHRFFMLDNLNHRCYKVDENYMCEEMFLQKKERKASSSKKLKLEYESDGVETE
jgi:hypothetical protein